MCATCVCNMQCWMRCSGIRAKATWIVIVKTATNYADAVVFDDGREGIIVETKFGTQFD